LESISSSIEAVDPDAAQAAQPQDRVKTGRRAGGTAQDRVKAARSRYYGLKVRLSILPGIAWLA
jgi:hypothetical protein